MCDLSRLYSCNVWLGMGRLCMWIEWIGRYVYGGVIYVLYLLCSVGV